VPGVAVESAEAFTRAMEASVQVAGPQLIELRL
jgi:hypothetical protein